jgi:hypothetical protein
MKPLASILVIYTAVMLGVHLLSWRLVERWYGGSDSWVKRRLTPLRVLRGEALYWGLVLAAWPLWPSVLVKIAFTVFGTIHFGGWLAAESRCLRIAQGPESSSSRRALTRAITIFDLAEVFPLVAVAACGLIYLLGAR